MPWTCWSERPIISRELVGIELDNILLEKKCILDKTSGLALYRSLFLLYVAWWLSGTDLKTCYQLIFMHIYMHIMMFASKLRYKYFFQYGLMTTGTCGISDSARWTERLACTTDASARKDMDHTTCACDTVTVTTKMDVTPPHQWCRRLGSASFCPF